MPAPPILEVGTLQPPHPVALAYGIVLELTDGVLAQSALLQSAVGRAAFFKWQEPEDERHAP